MKKLVVIGLHLIYWMVSFFSLGMFIFMVTHDLGLKEPSVMLIRVWFSCFFIPGMIAFYSCYTFLFNNFLTKKRILALVLYSTLAFLVGVLIEEAFLFSYILPNPGFVKLGLTSPFGISILLFLIALINGIMGFVLKGFITWYRDIKVKEELNKKNYEMELTLVKSQINPHFLFNTINNIDVLIADDAAQASAYLNKLSDIMRFMLYETKTDMIPLSKELSYIEKYIDLQKIRTSNVNYVNYVVEGDAANLMIAPMLFIPFIENAFKHTENKMLDNAINIKILITKETITFDCENKFSKDIKDKSDQNGLGNELIEKRLMLLYHNKHSLEVSTLNKTYKVKLIISQ